MSFILRIGYPFYFDFEDVLTQAGAGSAIDGWSGFFINGISDDGNTVFGSATNPDGKQESFIAQFTADYLRTLVAPLPQITSSLREEATLGEYFVYVISATGMPESFDAVDLPPSLTVVNGIMGGTTIREGIIEGIPTVIGEFPITISASNTAGTTSAALLFTVHDSPLAPKLLNISTRAAILTGDNVLIGGFVVTGNEPKRMVLRAIGPSLAAFGITSPLLDPVIELHEEDGTILTNDNWKDSQRTEIEATGFAPADDRESVFRHSLPRGLYGDCEWEGRQDRSGR